MNSTSQIASLVIYHMPYMHEVYVYIFHLSEWVVNDMHVVGTTLACMGHYVDNCGCAHRDTFAKLGFWKFGGDGEFNWKT